MERKTILIAYGLFAVMMAVSFIPTMWGAALASLLYVAALAVPYIFRARAAAGSLTENHMTYIIRTLWIASLMATLTVAAGVCYVLALYDPSSINECTQRLMDGSMDAETCATNFIDANRNVLYVGGFIAAAPVALYCLQRLFKGTSAALRNIKA